VFGWAAWRISAAREDRAFLAEVYPALRRQHRYWQERLQVEPDLYAGGFLGMDNLPRAAGRPQADGSAWMAFFARHLALIADALGEPADAARYREEVTRISAAVNARLWNEATGLYHDLNDARNGFLPVESYSGLIPLIAGIVPDERLPRLIGALRDEARFLSPAGIRSVPRSSGAYRPGYAGRGVNSNWLGPVWMPITYLLIQAVEGHDRSFADALRERVVRAVEADWKATGRFHEYFHGDTGEGLGADEQGWTLLVANLIHERWGH
jgi:glycogen debranching enzyme